MRLDSGARLSDMDLLTHDEVRRVVAIAEEVLAVFHKYDVRLHQAQDQILRLGRLLDAAGDGAFTHRAAARMVEAEELCRHVPGCRPAASGSEPAHDEGRRAQPAPPVQTD